MATRPPKINLNRALDCVVEASHKVGHLLRKNHRSPKKINEATRHDIKLELDVRSQAVIERHLLRAFPEIPILGEEGIQGDPESAYRWVVDPIDGTVNFAHGIPHCCISIALQRQAKDPASGESHESVLGVVYDPFCDELWTALQGRRARLNGRPIQVSACRKLSEAIVSIGFAKQASTLEKMLPTLNDLLPRVRKVRMMGSAALALSYVASGRLDAYLEYGLRIWDVAAGGLILECAGGDFWNRPVRGAYTYQILANNGRVRRALGKYL